MKWVWCIALKLRAPFVYLCEISHQIRDRVENSQYDRNAKTDRVSIGLSGSQCSDTVYRDWEDQTLSEQSILDGTHFLQRIAFPQRTQLVRLSTS